MISMLPVHPISPIGGWSDVIPPFLTSIIAQVDVPAPCHNIVMGTIAFQSHT